MPTVAELRGLWRRSLIAWPDGRRDLTTAVVWLQGLHAYIDLRQPMDLPRLDHVQALDQLSLDDCRLLATQEGFAGNFSFDGKHFEWARAIDYQPKPLYSDAGSLHWDGDVLIEEGRDVAYIEHWHREPARPTMPVGAVNLADGTIRAAMLRVGSHFMFARDRRIAPPAEKTLGECVAAASDVEEARALVDCEIAFGRVEAQGFRITASTLPWRIGTDLEPRIGRNEAATAEGSTTRHWAITSAEGDLAALERHAS